MRSKAVGNIRAGLQAVALCLFIVSSAAAAERHTIRVIGREKVTVTTSEIVLGDLAEVTAQRPEEDDAVIALQKIVIRRSPRPGNTLSVSARRVLDAMRDAGVDFHAVGYALPRMMQVSRASRTVSLPMITKAVEDYLRDSGRDAAIENIRPVREARIAPGDVSLEVAPIKTTHPSHMKFSITARVEGEAPVTFPVQARVQEWREVPVATRPLERGRVVTDDDVTMARLNLAALPTDAVLQPHGVVGFEATKQIGYGEVFRNRHLSVPPVIESGARVTMQFVGRLFTATASAIALEAGAEGDTIRLRNDASKKIVNGVVVEPGLVRVGP